MSERPAPSAELERLAAQVERSASHLESTRRAVQSSIAKTDWQGIAGDSLRSAIQGVERDIDAARRALDAMAQVLRYGHAQAGSAGPAGSVGSAGAVAQREQQLGRWLGTTQLGLGGAGIQQAGGAATAHHAVEALEHGPSRTAQREHQAAQETQREQQAVQQVQREQQAAQLEFEAARTGQAALQATPTEQATAQTVLAGQAALQADQVVHVEYIAQGTAQAGRAAQHAVQHHEPPGDAV